MARILLRRPRLGDRPVASPGGARFYVDWIDRLIAQVNERGRFATPERRQEVVALFRRAQQVYRKIERTAP